MISCFAECMLALQIRPGMCGLPVFRCVPTFVLASDSYVAFVLDPSSLLFQFRALTITEGVSQKRRVRSGIGRLEAGLGAGPG